IRNCPVVVVALPFVSPVRNWASDTVSVLIDISSVRAAMSGNAGSAAAANEATREKEHTPKTNKRFGCLVDRRIGFSKRSGPRVVWFLIWPITAGCPGSASPYCDVCRFDDRCQTSHLAFCQCCEWLLASPLFARNVAAKVGQALAYVLVIECLVECIRERVENRLRYALRRKQRPPRQRLKFRQAGLYRSWDIW